MQYHRQITSCKVAQIITISKPGRKLALKSTANPVFDKLYILIRVKKILPNNQFRFHNKQRTIEQVHR